MGLDLSGVRRVVEDVLDDRLQLWRDAHGEADDVLDESTGDLSPCTGTPWCVWDGLGVVTLAGQLGSEARLDGVVAATPSTATYQAMLPVDAPRTQVGDVLVVVGSTRDAHLTGRRFRVVDSSLGSFTVVRRIRLEAIG